MKPLKLEELQVGELYFAKHLNDLYQMKVNIIQDKNIRDSNYRSFIKDSNNWEIRRMYGSFSENYFTFYHIPKAQPDTSTLEGKIEVMEASKILRIQHAQKLGVIEWIDHTDVPATVSWDWNSYIYRIHPDDMYDAALVSLTPPKKEPSWDDKTFNAWFESVQHWTKYTNGEDDEKPTDANCGFCKVFLHNNGNCKYCPIKLKTGQNQCHETPYYEARRAWCAYGPQSNQFKQAAKEELAFLLSLLPEDMKERYEQEKTKQDIPLKKKESSYRAWNNITEVPVGALIRFKNYHRDEYGTIQGMKADKIAFTMWGENGQQVDDLKITWNFNTIMLSEQEHSTDKGKTWLPCGVKVED